MVSTGKVDGPALTIVFKIGWFEIGGPDMVSSPALCYVGGMDQPKGTTADVATLIMSAMLRMPPRQHKNDPRVDSSKGRAQRRRREAERPAPSPSTKGDG